MFFLYISAIYTHIVFIPSILSNRYLAATNSTKSDQAKEMDAIKFGLFIMYKVFFVLWLRFPVDLWKVDILNEIETLYCVILWLWRAAG